MNFDCTRLQGDHASAFGALRQRHRMNTKAFSMVAAALFLCSCGSSPPDEPLPPETPNKAHYDTLAACGAVVCDGFAQRIEGGSPFSTSGLACIVEAMRDRKPGMYQIALNHTWSNGADDAKHLIMIGASGDVRIGTHRYSYGSENAGGKDSWDPTRHCSLAMPSFFDACLAAVKMGEGQNTTDETWGCVFPQSALSTLEMPWFENCEDQAPTCE